MPKVEQKKALCYLSHVNCGMLVTTEDGKATKIEGDPSCPLNQGRICERVNYALDFHENPRRVNYPIKRVGPRGSGKWERISWEQANTEIGAKLNELKKKHGSETLVFTSGTGRTDHWYVGRFFSIFGSPNNAMGPGACCWVPTYITNSITYGFFGGAAAASPSKCIVMWGHNTSESGDFPEYWGFEDFIPKLHPKIIVVDPRCIDYARKADIWLQPRPGTDGAIAMAWLNVIIEEELYDKDFVAKWCVGFDKVKEAAKNMTAEKAAEISWVPAEKIKAAARMFAQNGPSTFVYGLACDAIGLNATQVARAKSILTAICGNLNVEGGTYLQHPVKFRTEGDMEAQNALPIEKRGKQAGVDRFKLQNWPGYELINKAQERVYHKEYRTPLFTMCPGHAPTAYRSMMTGKPYPVTAMIVQAGNPFSSLTNTKLVYEAIHHLELFVVHEYVMTPAAMLADYVLPGADSYESPMMNLFSHENGMDFVFMTPGIKPVYERRNNYEFWRGLAEKTFSKDVFEKYWPWKSLGEAYDYMVEPIGESFASLQEKPILPTFRNKWHEEIDPETGKLYGFGTPTGKVECVSTIIEKLFNTKEAVPYYEEPFESPVRTPEIAEEYPLMLTAGARFMPYYHSEHRGVKGFRERYPNPHFQINFQTAADLGIGDGDWCWIETKRGKCLQQAKLDTAIHPQVISAQHGWWFPELPNEEPWLGGWYMSNINMVTDDEPDNCNQLQGSYNMKLALCKVTRTERAPFDTWTKR